MLCLLFKMKNYLIYFNVLFKKNYGLDDVLCGNKIMIMLSISHFTELIELLA